MSKKENMTRTNTSEQKSHQHRGKFTEGLLNKEVILKALNIRAGQTVLDAGCGNGYMAKLFSNEVSQEGKVYALDPDSHFIDVLKNETQGTNIKAIVADITRPTEIAPASVDLIYISAVIHGFSKKQMQAFLKEADRLLKTAGILAIVEIEKKEMPFGPPLKIRFSPEELKEIVPMNPLDTVKVSEHFYLQMFQKK